MARRPRLTLSERVMQRRASSRAPEREEREENETSEESPAPAEPLHVAKLGPLPVIAEIEAAEAPRRESEAPEEVEHEALEAMEGLAEKQESPDAGGPVDESPAPLGSAVRPPDAEAPSSHGDDLPIPGLPDPRERQRTGIVALAVFSLVCGVAVGFKIMRPKREPWGPITTPIVYTAPPRAEAPPPPPIAPTTSASATEPTPNASATEPSATELAPDATALREHALELLKRAKNPEAIAAASAALDADPTDALPYLVLGSALQDTGHWREAHRTYELCVQTARHGMVDECRAMLRGR